MIRRLSTKIKRWLLSTKKEQNMREKLMKINRNKVMVLWLSYNPVIGDVGWTIVVQIEETGKENNIVM